MLVLGVILAISLVVLVFCLEVGMNRENVGKGLYCGIGISFALCVCCIGELVWMA